MRSRPKPSASRSLRSFMREVEREGPSHYGEILKQSLNGADLWRMQVDEGGDLARRRQEHAPRELCER